MLEFTRPIPALRLTPRDPEASLAPYRYPPPIADLPFGVSADDAESIAKLKDLVHSRYWYHSIELPGGIVTSGEWDHRSLVPHYGLPTDLTGKRALDVATFDGFWAFELERRGARVTALDVASTSEYDFPPAARAVMDHEQLGRPIASGFEIARKALGSHVERLVGNVYDLSPDVHGTFDFVHVGDLLLHLESPTRALRAIRSVTGSSALIADAYAPDLDNGSGRQLIEYFGGWHLITWWHPSLPTLAQMVSDAGFRTVRLQTAYRLDRPSGETGLCRAVLIAEV